MDEESERILAEIRRARRLSVSGALKQGLIALRELIRQEGPSPAPYDIYDTIDLGAGGYARAPARRAKAEIARAVRERTTR